MKQLPSAPIPPSTIPPGVDTGPPPAGQGRLIVDAVEGPTPVQRVSMQATPIERNGRRTFRFNEGFEPLCPQTPCVAQVPAGTNMLLGFPVVGSGETEVELVHVGAETAIYRRALSHYTPAKSGGLRSYGYWGTILGSVGLTLGTVFLPVGLARDNSGMVLTGGVSLGAGALLLTTGIIALVSTRAEYQPGSSNHYAPGQ